MSRQARIFDREWPLAIFFWRQKNTKQERTWLWGSETGRERGRESRMPPQHAPPADLDLEDWSSGPPGGRRQKRKFAKRVCKVTTYATALALGLGGLVLTIMVRAVAPAPPQCARKCDPFEESRETGGRGGGGGGGGGALRNSKGKER
jgi:hypothetical protein